jgi:hypothetical protein
MGVDGRDITISRNDGTGSFGEATTVSESPLDPAILWVGFDDGNVQVTQDGGTTWTEVSANVQGIGNGTYVSRVAASARGPGVAYATFDAHRDGDFRPFVYRTDDFGMSWAPLHGDLPEMGSVNVIVEHPDNEDVLFVGTEHALLASTDAGTTWAKVPNLPTTAYDDLVIHPREKDLVIGTHGRSIWVLDDTRPFAEWTKASGGAHLFSIAPGRLKLYKKDTSYRGQAEFAGENPADGVLITYRLGAGEDAAVLRIAREDGEVVREMEVPAAEGTHRVNWDLRHPLPGRPDHWERFDDEQLARSVEDRGHFVSPGRYTVTLAARGTESSQMVEVRGDPEMPITVAEYRARELFLLEAQALGEQINELMRAMGVSGGGGFGGQAGAQDTPQARVRRLSRSVSGIQRDMNGGGVRPGTLYPPTKTMRDALAEVRRELAVLKGQSGG